MDRPTVRLGALNAMGREEFVATLGFVFEESPWVAEAAWPARPFASVVDLHRAMVDAVDAAGADRRLALVRAHPDLVGRAALAGTLAPASAREQAAAGLDSLDADEVAAFQRLNAAYQARFGFPFVICARQNKKDAILAGFQQRLANNREQELATALAEVAKIAWLRLGDLVAEE